jgi:hypothetical protein
VCKLSSDVGSKALNRQAKYSETKCMTVVPAVDGFGTHGGQTASQDKHV